MDGVMNENQLTIVKEYDIDEPLIQKIDSIIEKSIGDCHDKYFHTFDHICDYDLNFTNITNNEIVNFTISEKCMGMYELKKKLTISRENFIKISKNRGYIQTHCNDCRNPFHFACRQWYLYNNPQF